MSIEQRRLAYFQEIGAPVTPRRVPDRQGREVYLMERGRGDPVLVVHGGGGNAGDWAPLVQRLGEEHRWILVDRPGHGLSYPVDYRGSDYRGEAARFVEDVLDGLGLQRVTLVGNSMGGYFSLCFALAHPERVERLVLLGAPAGLDRWIPRFMRLLAVPGLNRVLGAIQGPMTAERLRDRVYATILVAHADRVPAEQLEIGVRFGATETHQVAWRTLLERVLDLGGFRKSLMIREEVARLEIPTTFLWGDRDAFAPPASGHDLAARMPHARVEEIPDAGHSPWIDQPEECARRVLAALATRARGVA